MDALSAHDAFFRNDLDRRILDLSSRCLNCTLSSGEDELDAILFQTFLYGICHRQMIIRVNHIEVLLGDAQTLDYLNQIQLLPLAHLTGLNGTRIDLHDGHCSRCPE